jgi:transcriptional regulator with XRE-family HTH domain
VFDPQRIGRSLRAIRIRLGLRQVDVAAASGLARSVISRIELGEFAGSLDAIKAVCSALGADLDVRIRWRGDALDRLLDERHAGIVERFVRLLKAAGWETWVEVTFNHFGDRGSIDVLGWYAPTRSLLIAEIKSVIVDAQGTLAPFDRKVRLGREIGRSRGLDVATVSRVLVVRGGSTNRRRIGELAATFDSACPERGAAFRHWVRAPSGSLSALIFLPDSPTKGTRRGSAGWERVNAPRVARRTSQ